MAILTVQDCLDILDSVAYTVWLLKMTFGTGYEDWTASKACLTNYHRIKDLWNFIDHHSELKKLLDYAYSSYNAVVDWNIYLIFQDLLSKIWKIQGGLDDFLTVNDERIREEVAKLYWDEDYQTGIGEEYKISPHNIMPPSTTVGYFEFSGNSYTHYGGIDTSKYGKAFFYVYPDTDIGSNDLVLTVTLKKIDDTIVEKEVTVPGGTAAGTEILIGDGSKNDMFVDAIDCQASQGNDGDAVYIHSVEERAMHE